MWLTYSCFDGTSRFALPECSAVGNNGTRRDVAGGSGPHADQDDGRLPIVMHPNKMLLALEHGSCGHGCRNEVDTTLLIRLEVQERFSVLWEDY